MTIRCGMELQGSRAPKTSSRPSEARCSYVLTSAARARRSATSTEWRIYPTGGQAPFAFLGPYGGEMIPKQGTRALYCV